MSDAFENDSELDEIIDSDSDRDSDISTILQYLIRSGQVRIISASSSQQIFSDVDTDFVDPTMPSLSTEHIVPSGEYPDASSLKNNALNQAILLRSGALNDKRTGASEALTPLPCMFRARELGMNGRLHFSQGDRCQITQRVLPNKMSILDSYHAKVFCGTYAKNGDAFMSASQDYIIRMYDTRSQALFKLKRSWDARDVGWSILDLAVSPDGSQFVYCSWSECFHICTICDVDQEVQEALPLHPEERRFCIFALCFSQDGHEILGGANDRYLYVYNREVNKRTLRISSHVDDVNTVAFADNTSQILFSASDDGLCKVWDRRTLCEASPKPVGIFAGHEDGITYVDSKGDGRYLITNSKDQSVKLWDMRVFSPSTCTENAYKNVKSHNWDYRWQRVPRSIVRARRHQVWDTSLMTYRGHNVLQTLIRCHFSPESTTGQRYIYSGCSLGRIVVYDVLTGKVVKILNGHTGCVRDVSWHPYRNEIMSSSWDGTIAKWTYSNSDLVYSRWEDSSAHASCDSTEEDSHSLPRRSQRLADQLRKQGAQSC